jgi:hypothetical protein
MTYEKPEITVLGDASRVIYGIKNDPVNVETNSHPLRHSFELED